MYYSTRMDLGLTYTRLASNDVKEQDKVVQKIKLIFSDAACFVSLPGVQVGMKASEIRRLGLVCAGLDENTSAEVFCENRKLDDQDSIEKVETEVRCCVDVIPWARVASFRNTIVNSSQHTLKEHLPAYVQSKTQHLHDALLECVNNHLCVRVISVIKEDFENWCDERGYIQVKRMDQRSSERRMDRIDLDGSTMHRWANVERPMGCWVKSKDGKLELVVVVVPGLDYVKHMAQLLLAKMYTLGDKNRAEEILCVEPDLQRCIDVMERMDLEGALSGRAHDAYVVLGYSEFMWSAFKLNMKGVQEVGKQTIQAPEAGAFFGVGELLVGPTKVVFLSCRHTFWGDIAYFFVRKLCELGVRGVLYAAKLGSLKSPKDAQQTLYVPTSFASTRPGCKPVSVKLTSCLSETQTSSNLHHTGHVSIATIFDETVSYINALQRDGFYGSIDDEIGPMARAIAVAGRHVDFGCVHYPTDYLNLWGQYAATGENMMRVDAERIKKLKARQAEVLMNFLAKPMLLNVPPTFDRIRSWYKSMRIETFEGSKEFSDFWINVRLLENSRSSEGDREIGLEEIFSNNHVLRVLVNGPSGSGKSMWLRYICYQWGHNLLLKQFSLVVLVQLQDFKSLIPSLTSWEQLLCKALPSEINASAVWEFTLNRSHEVLWLIDGVDEVKDLLEYSILKQALCVSDFLKCAIIVSRKEGADHVSKDIVARLGTWSLDDFHQYAVRYEEKMQVRVVNMLTEKMVLRTMTFIPILAELLCFAAAELGQDVRIRKTPLYLLVVTKLIRRRHLRNSDLDESDVLNFLGKVAWISWSKLDTYVHGVVLNDVLRSDKLTSKKDVLISCGPWVIKGELGDWSWMHRSFLEFLSAYHIMHTMDEGERNRCLMRLVQQQDENANLLAFVCGFYEDVTKCGGWFPKNVGESLPGGNVLYQPLLWLCEFEDQKKMQKFFARHLMFLQWPEPRHILLMLAATIGATEAVIWLSDLVEAASVTSALQQSCRFGHFGCAQHLMSRYGNSSVVDKKGWSAFLYACAMGHLDVVKLLLDSNAYRKMLPSSGGETGLLLACGGGHVKVAKYLIEKGASVTERDKDGGTAFIFSAFSGNVEMLSFLVDSFKNDIDVRTWVCMRDNQGACSLAFACSEGHYGAAEFLIANGAVVNDEDERGWTPLHVACKYGHISLAQLLLQHGADPDVTTSDTEETPLELAPPNAMGELNALISQACRARQTKRLK